MGRHSTIEARWWNPTFTASRTDSGVVLFEMDRESVGWSSPVLSRIHFKLVQISFPAQLTIFFAEFSQEENQC
ncbi:hypothetical protein EUGRSUZ_H03252 [Eucalyptus grandis]|uniref:Uncharacterized protein n=2 Tax=Eucalyptus grandis TaxID=71139 RepID=A0ACC3JX23_EUCGR|nr:hypothetical protein EUGRSUZ_H03252 [Eucalyptus grandis]